MPYREEPSVIFGSENNTDLFIRKVTFEKGYSENDFHNHPNSYEFYIVLKGKLIFANQNESQPAMRGSIVYFSEGELHRISRVDETAEMLLVKGVGSTKE